jgi:hypothetical protein
VNEVQAEWELAGEILSVAKDLLFNAIAKLSKTKPTGTYSPNP